MAVYRESVLTAFQEVEDNLAALRILREEAEKDDQAIRAAERSLSLAMNRYEAGVTSYLEVITAQTASLAVQRAAVDVLRRRLVASVLLVKAVGGGWEGLPLPFGGKG